MGRMHASVYGSLEGAELACAVDHDRDRGVKLGVPVYATLDEALVSEQFAVVDICLPTHLHRDATLQAAQAGKHVFCEKPMALSVADADEMIAATQQAGVSLMIGHCIRFWPEYALLKQIADEGRYGRLLSINLTRYGEFPTWSSENWLAEEPLAGGGALDMHIHDTDFALYLLGSPSELRSWGTDDGRGIGQIFTTMIFRSPLSTMPVRGEGVGGGEMAIAHLEGGWNLPPKTPFKMAFRAIFEHGAAIMDGGPMTVYGNPIPNTEDVWTPDFPKMAAHGGGNISDLGGYYHELAYFVECLCAGKPMQKCTPESARESLRVCLEEIRQAKGNIRGQEVA